LLLLCLLPLLACLSQAQLLQRLLQETHQKINPLHLML
jgi:hypothetical protein